MKSLTETAPLPAPIDLHPLSARASFLAGPDAVAAYLPLNRYCGYRDGRRVPFIEKRSYGHSSERPKEVWFVIGANGLISSVHANPDAANAALAKLEAA